MALSGICLERSLRLAVNQMKKVRILLVEDELVLRKNLMRFLRRTGHEVACVGDSDAALVLLKQQPFDILITDVVLPNGDVFALMVEAKRTAVRIIVITAYGSPQIEETLRAVRVFAYLEKPLRLETLLCTVEKALIERVPGQASHRFPSMS